MALCGYTCITNLEGALLGCLGEVGGEAPDLRAKSRDGLEILTVWVEVSSVGSKYFHTVSQAHLNLS